MTDWARYLRGHVLSVPLPIMWSCLDSAFQIHAWNPVQQRTHISKKADSVRDSICRTDAKIDQSKTEIVILTYANF